MVSKGRSCRDSECWKVTVYVVELALVTLTLPVPSLASSIS